MHPLLAQRLPTWLPADAGVQLPEVQLHEYAGIFMPDIIRVKDVIHVVGREVSGANARPDGGLYQVAVREECRAL